MTANFYMEPNTQKTPANPVPVMDVGSDGLLAAVAREVRLLEKEIELMKLRMNEEADPVRKEMIRTFGSCLWRHKRELEKAQAANTPSETRRGQRTD